MNVSYKSHDGLSNCLRIFTYQIIYFLLFLTNYGGFLDKITWLRKLLKNENISHKFYDAF